MTYVVAGVTGNTGSVVAEQLLAAGKPVRVVVRDASKGAAWKARGAEVAVADLTDGAALGRALEGAQGAWLLVPPNMATETPAEYQAQVVGAVVEALRASRLGHLVFLSSVGAQDAEGTGPIKGLHKAEAALRAVAAETGAAVTFVRAGYFMENLGGSLGMLGQGLLPSFVPATQPIEMVATADIGKVAAAALLEGRAAAGVVELGGPARTMADAAVILSGLTGRTINVAEAPNAAVVPTFTGFGMKPAMAEQYREMLEGLTRGLLSFEGGHRRVQGAVTLEKLLPSLLAKGAAH